MVVVQTPPSQSLDQASNAEALFREAKQRERKRRLLCIGAASAAALVVAVSAVAATGGFSSPDGGAGSGTSVPIEVASNARTHDYQLPTDGWKPGDGAMTAAFFGQFHATLTTSGACAWMTTPNRGAVYLWPAGYRVRFDPTELLSPEGKVVARQGQEVNAGGGVISKQGAASLSPSPALPDYCGRADNVVMIESSVAEGHGLS
jgi:hypothetical protein